MPSLWPSRTTRTVPPCSTTKIRRRSPGGAVTYSGESNEPTRCSRTAPSATSAADPPPQPASPAAIASRASRALIRASLRRAARARAPRSAAFAPSSAAVTFFLGTVRPDGRPPAAGVGAIHHDGAMYVVAGPSTRKVRNLAAQPACTLSARLPGIDLVLEGEAHRVTDAPTLAAMVAVYDAGGWPAEVDGDAFTAPHSAPSAGPPPWHLHRMRVHTAFGVTTEAPYGATRWRF